MNRVPCILIALSTALTACPIQDDPGEVEPTFEMVGALGQHLIGVFDSEQQSIDDPQYFAIQLVTCPVDAPDLGDDVVYVEQAMLDNVDAPYRQRLYVLEGDDDAETAMTTVHALVNPSASIGLCDEEKATFGEDDVTLRSGCGVRMDWDSGDEAFVGETADRSCESTMNGASYATAEVWIGASRITSWDRGFDANDDQVWGAVAGPYEFLRRE